MNDAQAIKIAILAMGGEGGGVLADWLVSLAEDNHYIAQTTSVPGVAQRTGATIYYVELFRRTEATENGAQPVLALMPLPGDVDVVLASELMEAARAVQRGLVTPDRTTLVTSTHRVYSIAEKMAMGDGRSDSKVFLELAQSHAQRFLGYDMELAAAQSGSVISAVLFGTLAGAGVLPFTRHQFEETIRRGGVGVEASLRAFANGWQRAQQEEVKGDRDAVQPQSLPLPAKGTIPAEITSLISQATNSYKGKLLELVMAGLRRLVDYQGPAYAKLYLTRMEKLHSVVQIQKWDEESESLLMEALARHLALWMSYEDAIRVADLKIRAARFDRVKTDVRSSADQVLAINEFMHPRLQEVADVLPVALATWLLRPGRVRRLFEKITEKGRVVQTSSIRGYLLLSCVAGLQRWRQYSLRYRIEQQRIESWLADILEVAPRNPALAIEIIRCQRLVKGYGDTHARGLGNFEILRKAWLTRDTCGNRIEAAKLAVLRDAALADEDGRALGAAIDAMSLA